MLRALAVGSGFWLVGSIGLAVLPGKGQPLPEIELATAEGTRVKLSDFKGRPTVVNLWATWCPPCAREMPGKIKRKENSTRYFDPVQFSPTPLRSP